MPQFAFTVTDGTGRRSSGVMVAPDRDKALKILSEKDLVVTRLSKVGVTQLPFLATGPRLRGEALLVFTQQLAAMLDAGLTVKGALEVLLNDTTDPNQREVYLEMANGLGSGGSLTDVLARYPTIFDEQYVAMVAAGESGGKLAAVLTRLAVLIESSEALKRKVKSAMYYPALVSIFAFVVVTGMFIFGVPRFRDIYAGFGGELPLITRLTIGLGNVLAASWPYILVLLILSVVGTIHFINTERGRYLWDSMKLGLPLIGTLTRKVAISRFARTLGTLHSSGVPILQSLDLVAASMGNVVMEKVVRNSREALMAGESIVEPLRQSGMFTEMSISMIAAGDSSGRLDVMLDKVGDYYDAQVEYTLRGLTTLIEPIIMIGVGITVGIVVIAMILPIFKMATLLFN